MKVKLPKVTKAELYAALRELYEAAHDMAGSYGPDTVEIRVRYVQLCDACGIYPPVKRTTFTVDRPELRGEFFICRACWTVGRNDEAWNETITLQIIERSYKMKKCKCGHSGGVHWHACRLASCGYPGCKCKRFDEAKEARKTETQTVLEQVLRENSERQK